MKRQFHWFAVMLLLSAFPFSNLFSNNLSVSNVTYNLTNSTVTFDLRWENGWSNKTSNNHNWDAAWVIVKFKDCAIADNSFTHGTISTALSDHTFNGTGGGGSTTYEPTKNDGTVGIDAAPNNTGVMLRNFNDPLSGIFNARVTLKVTNLPGSGTLDLRVFGFEMVFIPQSSYLAGDGNGVSSASTNSFATALSGFNPILIATEASQTVFERVNIVCPSVGNCPLTANFPKGYKSFYMMKYEISQGQYADFLNTVNSLVQTLHYPNQTANRHTIASVALPPAQYVASRPDRGCNWLSWSDFSAYLDWAALRPLTELEFEKAARGPNSSIFGELAWGNNSTTAVSAAAGGISTSPENGTETITTPNANICAVSVSFTSGDANGVGPLRCGIFATSSTSTRTQSGGSFYGVMDLSGNINEYYVSILSGVSSASGPSINGISWGDGYLDASGNMDVVDWPAQNLASPSLFIIRRGGGFNSTIANSVVSIRNGGSQLLRVLDAGGRGGR